MTYFSGACAGTGAMMYMLRSSRFAFSSPWLQLAGSLGFLLGTMFTSYEDNWALKNALFGGFVGMTALSLVPLIHIYAMPVIYDALIATGVTMGSLGLVAYNSPSE
jgi:FtsH-binding integral membrane protein